MTKHTKKMIAPIVITLLIICYLMFYFWIGFSISEELNLAMKIILLVVPVSLIILSVVMLFERIQGIKGGETDDLSKY
ncbi:MAG: hypothetical protein GX829_00090 [Clostridium sp.]|nr:hypothetical protein [Clostridium sp.]